MSSFLIGLDLGSSSIKAALVDVESSETVGFVQYPEMEMGMISPKTGWAEQDPEIWWDGTCGAIRKLVHETEINSSDIAGIGIAYQMHGLVLVDKQHKVLRPSIIWCDSRAVEIGDNAFDNLGRSQCLSTLLNSPGNFTASKLSWVITNEPHLVPKIDKFMLPGDFIAMKMTGEISTTISGLSEGILWDFDKEDVSKEVLDYFDIQRSWLPNLAGTFDVHGELSASAAEKLGLAKGTPVSYRAGDQPNNAFSLNVNSPGEVAGTGGTSGVVYAISDELIHDDKSRINGFAHVNHRKDCKRIGLLLCVNGAGIQYGWLKKNVAREGLAFEVMSKMAESVPIGSEGLGVLPFGNGAERILENKEVGAQIYNLQFNRHNPSHVYRAALEGVAFSFVYGMEILAGLGVKCEIMRVGNDNLFRSIVFGQTIAALTDCRIEVLDTTGAAGAAKGAGIGLGLYSSPKEAMGQIKKVREFHIPTDSSPYLNAYRLWKSRLDEIIHREPKNTN